jgi:hypothetical protein
MNIFSLQYNFTVSKYLYEEVLSILIGLGVISQSDWDLNKDLFEFPNGELNVNFAIQCRAAALDSLLTIIRGYAPMISRIVSEGIMPSETEQIELAEVALSQLEALKGAISVDVKVNGEQEVLFPLPEGEEAPEDFLLETAEV